MPDHFLNHYNRELLAIRRAAATFANANPRIAGRLRLSEDTIEDPHVERLIEAFAFMTARIRQKLEDDFPELNDTLLDILYPHLDRPIPSMSILQMQARPELSDNYTVPSGTFFNTETVDGDDCLFRSTFDVTLFPISVKSATLSGRPIRAPECRHAAGASGCLRLTLETAAPEGGFTDVSPPKLRFFLRGQPQLVYSLYELLLNDVAAIAVADGPNDRAPVFMDPSAITAVGFDENEGVLPYTEASHPAYRLLTEYFAFPEKFLFVDLALPQRELLNITGKTIDIFCYINKAHPDLERSLNANVFALGCVPVINLFSQTVEPITLDQRHFNYRLIPDSQRQKSLEVYSITTVHGVDSNGNQRALYPFYSIHHTSDPQWHEQPDSDPAWWLEHREERNDESQGGEVSISLSDLNFHPELPADEVLVVDTLCFNRNLPERVPFGGGKPHLRIVQTLPMVQAAQLLIAPTPTLRPMHGNGGRWRLISNLSLNHLSLVTTGKPEALRETLLLYDFRESPETKALIDGIIGLSSENGTARVRSNGRSAFCRGIDITILFEEANFSGNGVYLMASILERFFGLVVSVNSFSRLTTKVKGRTGVLKSWPARAGERILL